MNSNKCDKIQFKILELEKIKSIYCYDKEKMDREYCISLSYNKWLLKLEYEKYCRK